MPDQNLAAIEQYLQAHRGAPQSERTISMSLDMPLTTVINCLELLAVRGQARKVQELPPLWVLE